MVSFSYLILLIFFINISNTFSKDNESEKNEKELIFVFEHSRHGKRSPVFSQTHSKTESFKDIYGIHWEKSGELTNYGKLQHYFLGLRNKYKYKNFIDFSDYDKDEILAYTSGVKRSTLSLYFQLLGMFSDDESKWPKTKSFIEEDMVQNSMPPNIKYWKQNKDGYIKELLKEIENFSGKKQNINIDWDKINPNKFTILKKEKRKKCKNNTKYINLLKKVLHKSSMIKKDFLNIYSENLRKGLEISDDEILYKKVSSFANVFISDYEGRKNELEPFFKRAEIDPDEFYQKCLDLKFFSIYNLNCHSKSCIMKSSKDFIKLIDNFERAIRGKNGPKMIIELGHDITVNTLQIFMSKAFGIKYNYCVFGANLFFELYKKGDEHFVEYYDNDELLLNIEYKQFKKKVMSFVWTKKQEEEFCDGDTQSILNIRSEQDEEENENENEPQTSLYIEDDL